MRKDERCTEGEREERPKTILTPALSMGYRKFTPSHKYHLPIGQNQFFPAEFYFKDVARDMT
jgi:hypothetical protein